MKNFTNFHNSILNKNTVSILTCFFFILQSLNAQVSNYIDNISSSVGIALKANTLYIGSIGNQSILKVDLTDPNLTVESYVTGISFPTKFVVIDNDLYFSAGLNSVQKIDLTQPNPVPELVASISDAYDLAVKENYLYVGQRNFATSGIVRFDHTQTNPTVETVIEGINGVVAGISINNNDLYFTSREKISKMNLLDTNPNIIDVLEVNNVLDIYIKDEIMYYSIPSNSNLYIRSLDLSNEDSNPETLLSGKFGLFDGSVWDISFLNDDNMLLVQQSEQRILKLSLSFIDPTTSPDFSALQSIYNDTNGANWNFNDNWLDTSKSLYSWHGIEIDETNKVTSLNLTNNALSGTFPIALSSLNNLERLVLSQNELTGTLGTEIGELTNLTNLSIANNNIGGEIPNSLANLNNLEILNVSGNNFEGVFPNILANLNNLVSIDISGNNFEGLLLSSLDNLNNLEFINISGNNFEGVLPNSLANLNNLININISGNNFSGNIPFNSPNALIDITNNLFNFSDIEPFFISNNFNFFIYSPQKTIDSEEIIESPTGSDIEMSVDDSNLNRLPQESAMNNVFQWFKDNVAITGANANTYTIVNAQESDSGVYRCEITNSILPNLTIIRPNIILTIDDNLSVENFENNSFIIYPNPVKNWITIKTQISNNTTLDIYDINGKQVLNKDLRSEITVLNIDYLQSGLYIVTISNNHTYETKRFIKN